ncbi:MAG TPA: alpha/beta hydrolase-fold protein [Gemmatimonadaceae bacterium]|nr:alpha/beta hydrolase-fold protein [Gemmatimonadaceae bacterium]
MLLVPSVDAGAQPFRPIPYHMDARAPIAAKRLGAVTLFDSSYQRPRRIWIYTPQGYDPQASAAYPLIIAFDGNVYRDTMPLPLILDSLLARGKAPAFVGVLVDDSAGSIRIGDLGNAAKMAEFIGKQLIPYMREHWRVTSNPRRVIATGSSAGGLGAAYVALMRPDLIGNVLSQSGAFWRGAEGSDAPPYEWLTTKVIGNPGADVTFFLDVGEVEDHATLGGSGPNFRDANRRFRDALRAKGYKVAYAEIPAGQHGPAYWMARLPIGIVTLTSDWQ